MSSAFREAADFSFVRGLERAQPSILEELLRLGPEDFPESPDSLGLRPGGYDERGWRAYALHGEGAPPEHARACPRTLEACLTVPGLVNASFSRLLPRTHLEPHRGELEGVLRCHLALRVPPGDLGLRFADETRGWTTGRCLVFDDSHEHEAWNRGAGPRDVLLLTFRP